jgi:diguanylate cyclase (GGDEF)-like protein/PAS domain S-box-containing protein
MPQSAREWLELLHPEDRAAFREKMLEAGQGVRVDVEYRLAGENGAWLHIRQVIEPLGDVPRAGRPARWFSTLQDVTEQRRAEQQLRAMMRDLSAEQRLLQNLMDSVPDAIFFKDRQHRFVRVNRVIAGILGLPRPEDAVGRPAREFFPAGETRQQELEDQQVMESGVSLRDRVRKIGLPNGKVLWTSTTKAPIRDESGRVTGLVGISRDVTERQRLLEELREREAGLRRAEDLARLAHVISGPDGRFESWSETLPKLIGVQAEAVPRSTREWLDLLHDEDRGAFKATSIAAALTGERADLEYRLRRADGTWIDVRQVMEAMAGDPQADGRKRWFSTLQDVTEQKQAEAKITRLNRVYAVLSGINTLIVRVRERDVLFREACRIAVEAGKLRFAWIGAVDRAAMELQPVACAGDGEDFLARVRSLLSLREPDSRRSLVAQAATSKQPTISNDTASDPRIVFKEDHAKRGIRSLAVFPLVIDDQAQGVLALHAAEPGFFDDDEVRLLSELASDISFALEHIDKVERLEYLASYDPLTGLANRTLLLGQLERFLRAAERDEHRLAVFIFNLERFKSINDAYGRRAGDALLEQLAERMRRSHDDPAGVGRLGGDEFALVLPRIESDDELARRVEDTLRGFFELPFAIAGTELRISAKAGVALFPNDATDPEVLVKHAESALKKAKQTGERCVFYAPQMTERVAEKLSLENQLRQAIEREEFVLHYQPKVALESRRLVGVEALIRWQSPRLGLVPPGRFIPLLEETGLILQVGNWALARASLDHRSWVERKLNAPRVAVNVSPLQLRQRDFVAVIEQAIIDGVAPTGIDLEITESLVMDDIKANIEKLRAVRRLGVRVAIDDFGTGYSSLGYLAQLPVESLKIDRSFIVRMQDDANAMTLVSTMISLAHSLRLKVVAEGVETEDQAKFLRLLRCDEMQGFLFSKPVPEAELTKLLARDASER